MGISGVGLVGGRREGSAESEQFAMGLSMLGLDRNRVGGGEIAASSQALVQPPAMAKAPVCARPYWRAPLDGGMMCMCASRRVSGVLFLGGGR